MLRLILYLNNNEKTLQIIMIQKYTRINGTFLLFHERGIENYLPCYVDQKSVEQLIGVYCHKNKKIKTDKYK